MPPRPETERVATSAAATLSNLPHNALRAIALRASTRNATRLAAGSRTMRDALRANVEARRSVERIALLADVLYDCLKASFRTESFISRRRTIDSKYTIGVYGDPVYRGRPRVIDPRFKTYEMEISVLPTWRAARARFSVRRVGNAIDIRGLKILDADGQEPVDVIRAIYRAYKLDPLVVVSEGRTWRGRKLELERRSLRPRVDGASLGR